MHRLIIILFFLTPGIISAQNGTKTFTTKFQSRSVTYNASRKNNECLEAVAWGIEIKTGKGSQFFLMPYRDIDTLKQKIGDAEVEVEVYCYDKPEQGSGAAGEVKQITMNGVAIYKED
ncbi:MAG TPA: hypothetical protein VFJ43_11635 [Bacteroidia bacterium]|nr:hypothetical protein [Bacteroidia bacterium]